MVFRYVNISIKNLTLLPYKGGGMGVHPNSAPKHIGYDWSWGALCCMFDSNQCRFTFATHSILIKTKVKKHVTFINTRN